VTDGLLEFFVPETIYVEMRATPPLEELPIEASEAHPRERAAALPRVSEQENGAHFPG
jgi:hypothetical protein